MPNLEDYNTKLEILKAIPEAAVKEPSSIPVDVYIQEAEELHEWSLQDKTQLTDIGLAAALIDDLPVRCGALRYAESKWGVARFSKKEAEQEWKKTAPLAYALRDELIHHFRFAFRKHPELLSELKTIAKGNRHADMLQDLSDLNELGLANLGLLTDIKMETYKLATAFAFSDGLSTVLARANSDRALQKAQKALRDRAYTHLKEAVDEVRDYGQYLFYRNEKRKKGYISQYLRRIYLRKLANSQSHEG